MIKLEYTEAGSETGITKNHVVTFDGNQTWGAILEEFFHFLNTAGFVIDQTTIGEMVEAAVDVHDNHLDRKSGCLDLTNTNKIEIEGDDSDER